MELTIEVVREMDGRWLAQVVELPGVMTYGKTRPKAVLSAKALTLHVIADRMENGEIPVELVSLSFQAA